jgi:hypothetical protein
LTIEYVTFTTGKKTQKNNPARNDQLVEEKKRNRDNFRKMETRDRSWKSGGVYD